MDYGFQCTNASYSLGCLDSAANSNGMSLLVKSVARIYLILCSPMQNSHLKNPISGTYPKQAYILCQLEVIGGRKSELRIRILVEMKVANILLLYKKTNLRFSLELIFQLL